MNTLFETIAPFPPEVIPVLASTIIFVTIASSGKLEKLKVIELEFPVVCLGKYKLIVSYDVTVFDDDAASEFDGNATKEIIYINIINKLINLFFCIMCPPQNKIIFVFFFEVISISSLDFIGIFNM